MVTLKYLFNTFGHNMSPTDRLNVSIYSDFYQRNIQCQGFNLVNNGFISFNDLDIPCVEEVLVTVTMESVDKSRRESSYTVRIPCDREDGAS